VQLTPYVGYLAGALTSYHLCRRSFVPGAPRIQEASRSEPSSPHNNRRAMDYVWRTGLRLPVIATNSGMLVLNGAILAAKLRYK
jgi:hypothetical protein